MRVLDDGQIYSFRALQAAIGDGPDSSVDYLIRALKKGIAAETIRDEGAPPGTKTLFVGHSYGKGARA